MAKATVVAVYFAFVFILSVSSQTPSEIKDQVTKIKAIAQAYDAFQKALEVNTKDVDHFKASSIFNLFLNLIIWIFLECCPTAPASNQIAPTHRSVLENLFR